MRYINWLIYVVIFSAIPIVANGAIDYWQDKSSNELFKGVRLIDFLICAFCLIGGALCERFNSKVKPSGATVGIGIILAILSLGIYYFVKFELFKDTSVSGRYPSDSAWVITIMIGYVFSIIYSLALMISNSE